MPNHRFNLQPLAAAAVLLCLPAAHAQTAPAAPAPTPTAAVTLPTVTINASADASAEGLTVPFAGGQVARGGRVGILGTQDIMETPFSTTSYTQELIRNQQAKSVGDVLQNDPSVRVARGFGNFQESYFIRGFVLSSDNVAYNGLYSLLPRQYISAELFERVELLRGATAFLNGVSPGGDGLGGSINLLPKRASNEPLTQVTLGTSSGSQGYVAADISRRFGADQATGIRINAARRDGGTAVDREKVDLSVASVGLDWRNANVRLSADLGWQDHRLREPRSNVSVSAATVLFTPAAPANTTNFSQAWTYSNERDTFGTVRGEYDFAPGLTGWFAVGARNTKEANSLASFTLVNAATGAGTQTRFDNTRHEDILTGEVGLRGTLRTGSVGHALVASASIFNDDRKNAFATSPAGTALQNNLYNPVQGPIRTLTAFSNNLDAPQLQTRIRLSSLAIGDTLSMAGDQLLVTVGLRHQKIDSRTYAYNTGAPATPYERSKTSPVAGVVYKFDKRFSAYANYVEGLTSGETAATPATNIGETLQPYVSKQKEIGVKFDGGSVGASAAFFSTAKPRGILNAANRFVEEGEDRHQGLELNVFGNATRGVRVLGGVTLLDATQQATGVATTSGKRVIGVPRAQGNLGVEWDVPALRGLSLDARAVLTGSTFANATNTLSVPGWTRYDLGARYLTEIAGKLVTLRARVDNVANKSYWSSSGGSPGSGYLVLGTPRTFVVSASVDF